MANAYIKGVRLIDGRRAHALALLSQWQSYSVPFRLVGQRQNRVAAEHHSESKDIWLP